MRLMLHMRLFRDCLERADLRFKILNSFCIDVCLWINHFHQILPRKIPNEIHSSNCMTCFVITYLHESFVSGNPKNTFAKQKMKDVFAQNRVRVCTHEFEQPSQHVQTHCSGEDGPAEMVGAKCPLERIWSFDTRVILTSQHLLFKQY